MSCRTGRGGRDGREEPREHQVPDKSISSWTAARINGIKCGYRKFVFARHERSNQVRCDACGMKSNQRVSGSRRGEVGTKLWILSIALSFAIRLSTLHLRFTLCILDDFERERIRPNPTAFALPFRKFSPTARDGENFKTLSSLMEHYLLTNNEHTRSVYRTT